MEEALATLAQAHMDVPEGHVVPFRIWHYPPGGTWITWVLFTTTPPTAGIVREVGWDKAKGFWRREAPIPEDHLKHILIGAGRLEMDAGVLGSGSPTAEYGLQGISGGVETHRVAWESPTPRELQNVSVWVSRTREAFEKALETSVS